MFSLGTRICNSRSRRHAVSDSSSTGLGFARINRIASASEISPPRSANPRNNDAWFAQKLKKLCGLIFMFGWAAVIRAHDAP
jgi:hypothetical protein